MLKITPSAEATISRECARRRVPESGGLRIFPRPDAGERSLRTLAISFVGEPGSDDEIVRQGEAAVFLDAGVSSLLESRMLDADGDVIDRLVLRPQPNSGQGAAPPS